MGKLQRRLEDFKKFAMRGNVLDLAIGVIVGGAFGKIVTSLVNDIVMPLFGLLLGTMDFSSMIVTLRDSPDDTKDLVLHYGSFMQNIVDFLIITASIYVVIKLVEQFRRKQELAPAEEKIVPPPRSEVLLEEILKELKKQNRE